MAALVAVSEGSLSSGEVVVVKAQTGVLPLSPVLLLTPPKVLSILALWPCDGRKISIGWFALQIIARQISKLLYNQGYDNIYCIT